MSQTKNRGPISPSKVLALGFLAIISTGAFLLMLPFASAEGTRITLLKALFTATSAVCVTGLTVVDTAASFSLFGEIVILCLIQLGGLGFMLFATSTLVLAGKRISLRNRMLLHETMNMPGLSGTVRMTIRFMMIVLTAELMGTILLAFRFIPMYGFWKGSYYGAFHSISAFCNAGFDLFGSAGSLSQFQNEPYVLLTVSGLVIAGGLGFAVLADIAGCRFHFRKMTLHTKIVLVMTGILLAGGSLFFTVAEWNNPLTLARSGMGPIEKILNGWFQAVTTRTAGFSSFGQSGLRNASKLVSSLLMFIGASPASTGGGIKVTTIFVLFALVRSVFIGREEVHVFRKRLPSLTIRTSLSIFLISASLLAVGLVYLSSVEEAEGFSVIDLLFEQASALGTVGLSTAGTEKLGSTSQAWLIVLMYLGRIGPLTMMMSLARRNIGSLGGIRYPEEQIIVG